MIIVDHDKVGEYATNLQNVKAPMAQRMSALFCLRTLGTMPAVEALFKAFNEEPSSELLMHEICYCLGQMGKTPEQTTIIQTFLEGVLADEKHTKVVHHEAAEAMGNLCQDNTLALLKKFENEPSDILQETCFLSSKLIEWKKATDFGKSEGIDLQKLKCSTSDPAPPFNYVKEPKYADVAFLQAMLLDNKNYDLFERYRAMFTLREINTEESVIALCQSLTQENFKNCSPLLKHEVAFVLAQMEEVFKVAIPFLMDAIMADNEASIVKHEALIAIGEMIEDKSLLEPLLKHPHAIVSESAEVALGLIDYRKAQYEVANEKRSDE